MRRSNDALKRVAALEARGGVPGPAGPKGEAGDSAALVLTFFAPVSRPPVPVPGGPRPSVALPGSVPQPLGLVGAEWPETGVARVTFNGAVHTCALSATVADDEGGEISAAIRSLTLPATTVEVRTRASDGTPAPRNFHLTVFCPRLVATWSNQRHARSTGSEHAARVAVLDLVASRQAPRRPAALPYAAKPAVHSGHRQGEEQRGSRPGPTMQALTRPVRLPAAWADGRLARPLGPLGRGPIDARPRARRREGTGEGISATFTAFGALAACPFAGKSLRHEPLTEPRRNRTYRAGVNPSPLVLKTSRATRPRRLPGSREA